MSYDLIVSLGRKVLDGGEPSFDEALALTAVAPEDIPLLLGVANKVRARFAGDTADTCQIVNARSGNCPENCKFCAQSVHHPTVIDTYPLLAEDEILKAAHAARRSGASRFSVVTAGCGMQNDPDFAAITAALRRIGRETALKCCCSLGLLSAENAAALKAAGVTRYHHNLEAGESFFPHICSTHTYQDRLATIRLAREAGLEICSGGIIGMGESWRQRLELAFALKELDVDSVPLNLLSPVKGTALENAPRLSPPEVLQTFALFRLILPGKVIRYAGGRDQALGEFVPLGYLSGINGALTGNYLTTSGRTAAEDLRTIAAAGLKPLTPEP